MLFSLFYIIIKHMKNWLNNQTVVLTGASGGIGKELCLLLVRKYGAKVIGIGRSEAKMQAVKTELGELSASFSYYLFDVGEEKKWEAFKDELIKKDIRPILLINNAGAFPSFLPVEKTSTETYEKLMKTNFHATVYAVKALSPLLQGQGKYLPGIVNVASSASLCSIVGTSAYTATKGALKGFTEVLQLDEKGKKYVGAVYPGTTATELFRNDENTKNSALDKIAMPACKMAKKIARRILKRKKRSVVGWDAKLMNFTAKIMPVKGPALIRWVMKKSKSKVFKEVFNENKVE